MKQSIKYLLLAAAMLIVPLGAIANAQQPKVRAVAVSDGSAAQQPLLTEYKGVRLGMTADETRAKLGAPAVKGDDQDYYVFSENETAQIAYDRALKVVTISVDYMNGTGAPDYRTVVGEGLETRADGSLYKIVRRESQHFWVSYNRNAGPVIVVTITIQKY